MSKRIIRNENTSNGDTKKFKPISSADETHILDVNDDCLRKVLSYLNADDLCAIKNTCSRFVSLATDEFSARFGNDKCVFCPPGLLRVYHEMDRLVIDRFTMITEKHLRTFGESIGKLETFRATAADWELIFENCTELRELTVRKSNLENCKPIKSSGSSEALDRLMFDECRGTDNDFMRFMTYYGTFERLRVIFNANRCDSGGGFLRNHFPQLKDVQLEKFTSESKSQEHFKQFFRLNPQIERFCSRHNMHYANYIDGIVEHCQGIQSIEIECDLDCDPQAYDHEKIVRLNHLPKLKELCFNCGDASVETALKIFAKQNSLEVLGLSYGRLDVSLCQAIHQLMKLREIKFVNFVNMKGDGLELLMRGVNVKSLDFFGVDMTCEDLANAIANSRTLETVTCKFTRMNRIDENNLGQLINARKESGAGSALKLSLYDPYLEWISAELQQSAPSFIKLKIYDTVWKRKVTRLF